MQHGKYTNQSKKFEKRQLKSSDHIIIANADNGGTDVTITLRLIVIIDDIQT